MNLRPRAEFLFVGPTQAISDLAYSQAAGMIELDGELQRRFKIRDHVKEIKDLLTKAKLKIKTFDLDILTGPRPAGVLLDELHLLGKNAATVKVLRQLRGGRQSNPEGFLVILTTQSDESPVGAFRDELKTARAIRDGRVKASMLPILYEFPDDIARDESKWGDVTNWPMVLPNLGRSLRIEALQRDWEIERDKGAEPKQIWASQHLNIEIGLGLKSDRWVGADFWKAAADPSLNLEAIIGRSEVICIGIDGGGLDDLLGLAVLGREKGTRRWLLWARAWAHMSVLERRKSEAARLQDFEKAGELVIVDEMEKAFAAVAEIAHQVEGSGLLAQVGLDPVGIGAIVDALADREIEGEGIEGEKRVVGVSQGWTLNGAIKTTEVKLASRALVHAEQPLMDWSVGNAKVEPKGNAVIVTKQASGKAKIDPLMAAFDAVALMSRNPKATTSVYEERGLIIL
jgi:phage terminase large subunit-like protein